MPYTGHVDIFRAVVRHPITLRLPTPAPSGRIGAAAADAACFLSALAATPSTSPSSHTSADDSRTQRDADWARLLARAALGDADAYERFYDASHKLAYTLARRIAGDSDAEDVLADAYFQAWRESPRFDPARSSAATWLLLIVRSRAIDCVRRRLPAAGDDETEDTLAALPALTPEPAAAFEQRQQATRLHAALALLTEQERWVIGLAFFRDYTHTAISQTTGIPLGTVKSLALRGQRKLRDTMSRTP